MDVGQCRGATFNGLCDGGNNIKCCVNDPIQARPKREWLSSNQFRAAFESLAATRASAMRPHFNAAIDAISDGSTSFTNAMCYRVAAFVAQVGHESLGLLYMEELASGANYEGRTDLGNTQRGDGRRFKGRGPIQLTGRFNYRRASQSAAFPMLRDILRQPETVCYPSRGFAATAWYWVSNGLNRYSTASANDFVTLTRRINGGTNGLSDRQNRWAKAKASLGCAQLRTREASGQSPIAVVNKPGLGCTATSPCTECYGDCKDDADCVGDLQCFRRKAGSHTVPGCATQGYLNTNNQKFHNYCYRKLCIPANPCNECEGHCSTDSDCKAGLYCYLRSASSEAAVPGCAGSSNNNFNYCIPRRSMFNSMFNSRSANAGVTVFSSWWRSLHICVIGVACLVSVEW